MSVKVIVTRPKAQAELWVNLLQQQAVDAVALPLIGIEPAADAAAVQQVWNSLSQWQWMVFVSPNAVAQFFAAKPANLSWPAPLRVASLGPGTTAALLAEGVPHSSVTAAANDATDFDSEALWATLKGQVSAGEKALIVRGEAGRDWLAERLREAEVEVNFLSAYRRVAPSLGEAELALIDAALASPRAHLWFFSSSQAIDPLLQARPPKAWWASRAMATHPRIAEHAKAAGFAEVLGCRPDVASVFACIQSAAP